MTDLGLLCFAGGLMGRTVHASKVEPGVFVSCAWYCDNQKKKRQSRLRPCLSHILNLIEYKFTKVAQNSEKRSLSLESQE